MQFDVYENPSPRMRDQYPYVVDIQSDLLSSLATRMVVPLALTSLHANELPRRLCPGFGVRKKSLRLGPFEVAPLDARLLKKDFVAIRSHAYEIVGAMDAVMSGL